MGRIFLGRSDLGVDSAVQFRWNIFNLIRKCDRSRLPIKYRYSFCVSGKWRTELDYDEPTTTSKTSCDSNKFVLRVEIIYRAATNIIAQQEYFNFN